MMSSFFIRKGLRLIQFAADSVRGWFSLRLAQYVARLTRSLRQPKDLANVLDSAGLVQSCEAS